MSEIDRQPHERAAKRDSAGQRADYNLKFAGAGFWGHNGYEWTFETRVFANRVEVTLKTKFINPDVVFVLTDNEREKRVSAKGSYQIQGATVDQQIHGTLRWTRNAKYEYVSFEGSLDGGAPRPRYTTDFHPGNGVILSVWPT